MDMNVEKTVNPICDECKKLSFEKIKMCQHVKLELVKPDELFRDIPVRRRFWESEFVSNGEFLIQTILMKNNIIMKKHFIMKDIVKSLGFSNEDSKKTFLLFIEQDNEFINIEFEDIFDKEIKRVFIAKTKTEAKKLQKDILIFNEELCKTTSPYDFLNNNKYQKIIKIGSIEDI